MTREEQLEIENQILRDRLALFTGDTVLRDALRGCLNLSRQQGGILTLLFKRAYAVPMPTIYQQVFERPDGSGPGEKIVMVQVSKLRQKLATAGAPGTVHCVFGTNAYSLTPDLRAWLQGVVQPMGVAA